MSITRNFSIRLVHENENGLIFQAPELNTSEGKASKKFLIELLTILNDSPAFTNPDSQEYINWKNTIAFFPTNKPEALMDINSFNRLLAAVWVDDKMVTQEMLDAGHAKMVKR